MISVGVDIGGTFTDLVLFDEESGNVEVAKVPSTPADPSQGFTQGIQSIGVPLSNIIRLVHGTTVGTNAAIERKGAKTALVTTIGYRDLLEIGRGQRLVGGLFDPKFVRTPPLIPRPLRFEVQERMEATGEVLLPLDEEELRELGTRLAGQEVQALAICFLHSYLNNSHEQKARDVLRQALPEAFISISSDVLPEYREYERFSTTTFNSYLGPLMALYMSHMQEWLADQGYQRDLLIMTCNGGMVSVEVARHHPVQTILSGPAGGVNAGIAVAETTGLQNVITYDMGGTSTDVCLVKNLRAIASPLRIVGGLPLKTPQLDINTVGAGGGSIAWVDIDGTFMVGPQSAGADPGPACYGRGGTSATVTDANLLLQRLGSETALGGRLKMQPDLARLAIERIGEKLGLNDVYRVADGVVQVATTNMASAIREISVERGEDPRDFTLVAMGGAGPLHGCLVAEEVGIPNVVVPLYPGNQSAIGLLTSDVRHEVIRTYLAPLKEVELHRLKALLDEMIQQGKELLAREGIPQDQMEFLYSADMRYVGQGHELNVLLSAEELDVQGMERRFHQAHLERYTYSREDHPVQLVNLRVAPIGKVSKLRFRPLEIRGTPEENGALMEQRQVYFQGAFMQTPVYQRERMPAGMVLSGPAIVEEMGSTTTIFPGWTGQVDPVGNILLHAGGNS